MKLILSMFIASFASLFLLSAAPVPVHAQQFDVLERACEQEPNAAACNEVDEGLNGADPVAGENGLLRQVVNLLAIITAVIAVIIIIVAGINMATSTGDPNKVNKSRDAIIYAVVGLIVIALSRTIIIFIVNRID